jgi:SHS2 domain-containing protein
MGGFKPLEHTADVGVEAWSEELEGCFEQATLGVLDIIGAWRPGPGEEEELTVGARDLGGVLVDWLSEVLYLQDARDAVITSVRVDEVQPTGARGTIGLTPRGDIELMGTAVKAITFHQLSVERSEQGWVARVFVDV